MCNFSIDLNRYKKVSFRQKVIRQSRHITNCCVNSDLFQMDSLIKASHDFEQITNDFNEKVFLEFMKQITVWDFFGISKEKYLVMPEEEKRVKISQYYSDMKCKSTGEFLFNLLPEMSEMSEFIFFS